MTNPSLTQQCSDFLLDHYSEDGLSISTDSLVEFVEAETAALRAQLASAEKSLEGAEGHIEVLERKLYEATEGV